MTLVYDRPVKAELVKIFEQNTQICVTISEATETLSEHGHPHSDKAVRDNLFLLTNSGYLTYDGSHKFSLNNGAKDLTKKMPCELPQPKPKHRTSDHCDKCGKKFSHGEITYLHSFANIQLDLCEDCHEPKAIV